MASKIDVVRLAKSTVEEANHFIAQYYRQGRYHILVREKKKLLAKESNFFTNANSIA